MALVSREVASYPMQGAVERPPAPTLSPVPNPLLSLSFPASLYLSPFLPCALSLSVFCLPARARTIGLAPFSNASNYRNPTFGTEGGPL